MARIARDSRIETREARKRLAVRKEPYWRRVFKGVHIGYRKVSQNEGSWFVRRFVGSGRYSIVRLGSADDVADSNGIDVFGYKQAHERALTSADKGTRQRLGLEASGHYTVEQCLNDYLEWYRQNRKAFDRTQAIVSAHVLPRLGGYKVEELTTKLIRRWHENLVSTPARLRSGVGSGKKHRESAAGDPERMRSRRATANRVLTVLKAALNHAWREGKIDSDDAWRRVKPFPDVDSRTIRFLSEAESRRLLENCDADFADLVHAALLTGARYGELINLRSSDFNVESRTLFIRHSKNGRSRRIPLTDEGVSIFASLVAGKSYDERIFLKNTGFPWGTSHQFRPIKDACKRSGIEPAISFHDLRHSYASFLAHKGVSLQVIAAALGHSDTRITERHYAGLSPSYVGEVVRANLPMFEFRASGKVIPIGAVPRKVGGTRR